jgi:UDP-sulfoquinovose synthase
MNLGEKVEIFNQVAETLKVRDLATLIAGKTGVEIRNLENPRKEDAENELQVCGICIEVEMVVKITLWYDV